MKKIETIWHHLLFYALHEKRYKWTQQEIAYEFNYSLSTVNYALDVPADMGAIRKTSKFFILQDYDKLLYYWASMRKLDNDIIYKTYYEGPILRAQGELPAGGLYGGYSAARRLLGEAPADYDKLYYYFEDIDYFSKRFPENKERTPNIFVLKMQNVKDYTKKYKNGATTLPHTFVDVWNLPDWYSRDFTNALADKIHELLS